ncbi:MAG: glycoside hydrolase family 38 C-terminal domain-containing protein [Terracidiphilus sp.]|nr:glycoside hydrolase family 38 C-terminal domain-containing protein [Terracidiphilus sp.]MDR3796985.1 glycoside hydrolase family 38 C-terminal domain-containing protein [Terracidiphilus sp.]
MNTSSIRVASLLLAFAFSVSTPAQDAKPIQFSERAQQTLARLDSFGTLDAGPWKYHPGDMPNGEDPQLDDSNWQTVTAPHPGLSSDAIWLRREIVIPKELNGYDLTNARIEFHVAVGAGGPAPLILYMDGRQVALGTDLAPIVLWEKAKPGDHTLIAVKALATDVTKVFRAVSVTVTTDPARPSPGDLSTEIRADSWLLPAIPGGGAQASVLEEAVNAVDLQALDQGNAVAFDDSLRKAQAVLAPLEPLLQVATILMVGNSHMDAAWMWPWTETVETVRQTFGTAVQLMSEYPRYTYAQSTAQYFEWMQDKYPVIFDRIRTRVKEGRFELVGGMWIEPDLNIPDGESQVRQILIAKRYFQKNLGVDIKVGWNPDSFGYNWQLPQIYKKSGIDYFVTQKMSWNDTNQLSLKLFWWQAPDGSRVLAYFPHGYGNGTNPIDMAKDYAQAAALNPGASEMMHLYGVGDHGGGPTRVVVNQALKWEQPDKFFAHTEFATSLSFFHDVEKHLDTAASPVWDYKTLASGESSLPHPVDGDISLPVWNDELYLEYHRGTYTTQAAQKRNIRASEEWMLNAEKYSSLAWLAGAPYPQSDLNEAWKKVLFNEFHDLAAGTGIADIYKDAADDFARVHWVADQATTQSLRVLTSYIDTQTAPDTVPVLVFNPLAWQRTDIVEAHVQLPTAANTIAIKDSAGRHILTQILSQTPETHSFDVLMRAGDVPALGYERFTAAPAATADWPAPETDLRASGTTLENVYFRVVVDPLTGCITSLYDKRAKFESIAAGKCGNELQAFHDKPKAWDAWNIDSDYETQPYNLGAARSVQLIEHGPLRAIVRVIHSTASSTFVQDITLYSGIDRVEVANHIDWHEHHILLKAAFPLAATSPYASYEIPYGTIERPTTRDNSYEKARFEVPAIRWADLGDGKHGFSLLNDSKYGYDAKGNVLRLTLLRSPESPDPNADQGAQDFVYALYPHASDWKQALTERQGWSFNYKLEAMQVEKHGGDLPATYSFIAVDPENVILTTVKKAEDDNALILRVYEWAGSTSRVRIHLPHGALSAVETNLMEMPEGAPLPVQNDSAILEVKPYSINTIKVTFNGMGPGFWTYKPAIAWK